MVNSLGFLGQKVNVIIDRPLGSKHPKHGFTYEVNYGYIPNTKSPDGEEQDVYVLGIDKPIDKIIGVCIAVIHRTNDNNDKLVVTPSGENFSDKEISKAWPTSLVEKSVKFQEKYFKHVILRKSLE